MAVITKDPLPIKSSEELWQLTTDAHIEELIKEINLYITARWDRDSIINRSDLRNRVTDHIWAAEQRAVERHIENGPSGWMDE